MRQRERADIPMTRPTGPQGESHGIHEGCSASLPGHPGASARAGGGVDSRATRLRAIASELALPLSEDIVERLLAYLDLLQRWNATYNLTAVRDPQEVLTQHVADCLAVIGPLRRQHPDTSGTRLLDVGSGGGLPGVVIATVCPEWQVVCVDAVGKKAAFIRQAALQLRLKNLQGEHARVERLSAGLFNVVTSRALATLADFTALTRRQLAPDGVWMAMKGRRPDEEMARLPADIRMFHVEQLLVPGLKADRCLVWMKPSA
jgi:16S rRNA (guanine527-N7)-methyltransferase